MNYHHKVDAAFGYTAFHQIITIMIIIKMNITHSIVLIIIRLDI